MKEIKCDALAGLSVMTTEGMVTFIPEDDEPVGAHVPTKPRKPAPVAVVAE